MKDLVIIMTTLSVRDNFVIITHKLSKIHDNHFYTGQK